VDSWADLVDDVRWVDAAIRLIGRHALVPADVFFDLSLTGPVLTE
jgi:hypothetical protein